MGELTRSLIHYVEEVERRLRNSYGLNLSDVHVPALADGWREGWSVEDYVEWFAGKYDLQPVRVDVNPF